MKIMNVKFLSILVLACMIGAQASAKEIYGRSDCLSSEQQDELSKGIKAITIKWDVQSNTPLTKELRKQYLIASQNEFSALDEVSKCTPTMANRECLNEKQDSKTAMTQKKDIEAAINKAGMDMMMGLMQDLETLRKAYPRCE